MPADETLITPPVVTPPTPTDPPLMNTSESRTTTGEIKDQADVKPADPAPADTGDKPGDKPPVGAPEAYTAFTAPEGTTLDDAAIGRATPIFKELGLSQTQAQALVDLYAKEAGGLTKTLTDKVTEMRTNWRTETTAIKGIDQIKSNFDKAMGLLDPKIASDFREALSFTGAGDHPAIVAAIGKLVERYGEGTHVSGAGPAATGQSKTGAVAKPSAASAMWPNLPST